MDRNARGAEGARGDPVALCEEGVDRNKVEDVQELVDDVALCEEGVDRNSGQVESVTLDGVALCEEGVDRNLMPLTMPSSCVRSPSAKRAWIEIMKLSNGREAAASPSAKRAWIEIGSPRSASCTRPVALCEEGVDRNYNSAAWQQTRLAVALCEEGVDRNVDGEIVLRFVGGRPLRRGRG